MLCLLLLDWEIHDRDIEALLSDYRVLCVLFLSL